MEPRDVVGYFHHVTGLHRLVRRLAGQEPPEAKGQLRDDLPMGNGLALAPAAAPGLGHVRPLLGSGTVRAGPGGRSRLFPGVNDSGRRFFSITTKISRRDPRPCPHEYHPPIVYTPRSTRCSPPVTTWRPPWSRWPGSVPSCCCRPRWRRRSPASSAGTATPARPAPRAPRPVSATATARPR